MKVAGKTTKPRGAKVKSEEVAIDLEEQIRWRAYELYERRGREHGHEREDWLQAEAEVTAERNKLVAVASVKAARKAPTASTGRAKAKPVKKLRPAAQNKSGTNQIER